MRLRSASTAIIAALAVGFAGIAAFAVARQDHGMADEIMLTPDEIEWQDGPASLESGAQYAVLEGDPGQSGPVTMRLKLPAEFRIAPHTHPRLERVTVLEGTFRLGMGREFDEDELNDLEAGSFFVMPPGMEHFAKTGDEETIVQLNVIGPWEIHYINPEDDPRRRNR